MVIRLLRKTSFVYLLLAFVGFNLYAQGDTLTVQPKKFVYTRKGPNVEDWKRTFTVRYPVIKGNSASPAIKSINDTIDYWRVFELSLDENLRGEDQSLVSLDYRILFDKYSIFDISLTAET